MDVMVRSRIMLAIIYLAMTRQRISWRAPSQMRGNHLEAGKFAGDKKIPSLELCLYFAFEFVFKQLMQDTNYLQGVP